jgi:MerR family transcriptional regulator, heat shock protein HspR
MRKKKGYFSISVVAKMFSVHQQTIRMYEKEGLITPKRSEGNTRLFSEEDVDRLEEIIHLTHNMGINLSGVEMILKLQKKIKKLQSDMNKMFEQLGGQLEDESGQLKEKAKEKAQKLLSMKKMQEQEDLETRKKDDTLSQLESVDKDDKNEYDAVVVDDWEVDYENEKN